MTKKSLFFIILMAAMLSFQTVYADPGIVDLHAGYVDPNEGNDDRQRSPILVPEVEIEDYTLTFYTPCDGCVLRLLDENDIVVYSTIIPTSTTELVLPSYLSGDYEIQIVQGNLYFWGYIIL
jgi:hypothetical protein